MPPKKKKGGNKPKNKKGGNNKPAKAKAAAGGSGGAPALSAAEQEAAAELMMAELLAEEDVSVKKQDENLAEDKNEGVDTESNSPANDFKGSGAEGDTKGVNTGDGSKSDGSNSDSSDSNSDSDSDSDSDDEAFLLMARGLKGAALPKKQQKKGRKKGKKGEVEIKANKHEELLKSAGNIQLPMPVLETILSFTCSAVPALRSQSVMEFSHLAANGAWEVAGLKDAQREIDRKSRPRPRTDSNADSTTSSQTASSALQVQQDDYYDDSASDDEYYTTKGSNRTFGGQNRSTQHKVTQRRDAQVAKRAVQRRT
jgi:hypothetical protein